MRLSSVRFTRSRGSVFIVTVGSALAFSLTVFNSIELSIVTANGDAPFLYAVFALLMAPIMLFYSSPGYRAAWNREPYPAELEGWASWIHFLNQWLVLLGMIAVGGLLLRGLVGPVNFVFLSFFGRVIDPWIICLAVTLLITLNKLDRGVGWSRIQTILVILSMIGLASILVWLMCRAPKDIDWFPDLRPQSHWLSTVGLLSFGLWYVDVAQAYRQEIKRPERNIPIGLFSILIISALLGMLVSSLVLIHPELLSFGWWESLSNARPRMEFLVVGLNFLMSSLGLLLVYSIGARVLTTMIQSGYLPDILKIRDNPGSGYRRTFLFVLFPLALAASTPSLVIMPTAAILFLWRTMTDALLFFKAGRGGIGSDPAARKSVSSIVPGAALSMSLFLSMILPVKFILGGLVFLVLNYLYFYSHSRSVSRKIHRQYMAVSQSSEAEIEKPYKVLASLERSEIAEGLIRLGAALAKVNDGELILLHIIPANDQLSTKDMHHTALREREALKNSIQYCLDPEITTSIIIRIASNPAEGIKTAVAETDANIVLMGSSRKYQHWKEGLKPTTDRVFQSTSKTFGVLWAEISGPIRKIVVVAGGGEHDAAALKLGAELIRAQDGELTLIRVRTPLETPAEAQKDIQKTIDEAQATGPIQTKIVEAEDVISGLIEQASEADLLLVGASIDEVLNQPIGGGTAGEIAARATCPALLVKKEEKQKPFYMRRLWQQVNEALPTLPLSEREAASCEMKVNADIGTDFFALISIASLIALTGLVMNSSAVIIGAMLVAPLMSPILATGHGIAIGDELLIHKGIISTLKGIAVAVGISIFISTMLPPRLPTTEIMARTSPQLLDLIVAICAGAAAAYSVSRKSVSAALPGVAISVSLVPPLCVVGYGIGTSRFLISGGALVLFLTNLGAIILVGALVFLMLGFRPTSSTKGYMVRKALYISAIGLLFLVIPLGHSTMSWLKKGLLENHIELKFRNLSQESFQIQSFDLQKDAGVYVLNIIIRETGEIQINEIDHFQDELYEAFKIPIRVKATIIKAMLHETDSQGPGD